MSDQDKTEFGTKLVLDDHATEALEKVRGGFEHVSEKVKEAEHEVAGFLKQSLAVAAGFEMTRGIDSLKEFVGEAIGAARAEGEQVKALQGILAINDRAGRSFEELGEDARELHDNLEGMGIDLGVSTDTIGDAFEMVAARSKKSNDQIKELIGQMAYAGRAVPGGVDTIAAAYRDLETGIVRPKNAIVSLIKQTGLAAGSTRDIAKGLGAMLEKDPAKVFELADKAIGRMAEKTKNLPLGFGPTLQSLKDIRENIMESVGGPLLKAMIGPLRDLRDYLLANRDKFGEMAETLGVKMGEWIKVAASKVQRGFEYLKTHADEIAAAIEKGVNMAKSVVEFILAHKEEIAIAYGVRAVAPVVGGAVSAAKAVAGAAPMIGAGAQIGAASIGLETLGGAAYGAVASFAALSAAIAGVAAIAWAAKSIHDDVSAYAAQDAAAELEALKKQSIEGMASREELQRWRDQLVLANPELATMANHLLDMANAARQAHETQAADAQGVAKQLDNAAGNDASVQAFHDVFARMTAAHNDEQVKFLASFLSKHGEILDAMHKAHVDLTDVGGDLAKAFDAIGDHMRAVEVSGIVADQKKLKDKGALPAAMVTNFNGGQTFHIKQDFRDQDPDRIALVFRKDVLKTASARLQSRFAVPFGL